MTQYKLIKCYPGFTELGRTENTTWQGTFFYDKHPEFWQKVEEVDYDVLSFKGSISERLYLKQPNGKFVSAGVLHNYTFDECISKNLSFSIHSVKRLSDGEVFTIGDLIDFGDFGNKGFQPIGKIEVDYFDKTIVTAWDGAYGKGAINKWKKFPKKTPLFTTEDGVAIFDEKLKVFSVSECDFLIQNHQDYAWVKTRNTERKYHHFSTKEKAEEYVLLNKPCLSIMEVAPIFGQMHLDNSPDVLTRNLAKLKSLVQAKL